MLSTSSSKYMHESYSDIVASVFYGGRCILQKLSCDSAGLFTNEKKVLEEQGILQQALERFA